MCSACTGSQLHTCPAQVFGALHPGVLTDAWLWGALAAKGARVDIYAHNFSSCGVANEKRHNGIKMRQHMIKYTHNTPACMHATKGAAGGFEPPTPSTVSRSAPAPGVPNKLLYRVRHPPGCRTGCGEHQSQNLRNRFFQLLGPVLPRVLKAKPGPPQGLPPDLFPTPLAPKALGKTSRKRPLYIRGSPGGRGRVNFIVSHARGSVSSLLRIRLLDDPMIYVVPLSMF